MRQVVGFILTVVLLLAEAGADESFDEYLQRVRGEAIAAGVSAATVDEAFAGLEPDDRVIGYDRRQPEFVQTFDEYLDARVSEFRRREGKRLFEAHLPLLLDVSERYEVDPQYIVAIWGLETSFGRHQGKMSIIRSLATLGHDPRRSEFFTRELINALRILDEGHVSLPDFVGAWAGAMGQSQFMPGSFLEYAEDFDGDGRADIWNNEADVFASIANYLKRAGWQQGAGWGGRASISNLDFAALKPQTWDTRCRGLRHHSITYHLDEWKKLGVVPDSESLADQPYALIEPEEGSDHGYLAGGNFRAILSYNCANKYAVSVGLLADIIAAD